MHWTWHGWVVFDTKTDAIISMALFVIMLLVMYLINRRDGS